jgi:stage III sporulation protein AH
MKNIFKKNHIIITALAIMIVIAGYLSFTNSDEPEEDASLEAVNPDLEGYGDISGTEGIDMAQNDITEDDTGDTTGNADDTTDDQDNTQTDGTQDGDIQNTAADDTNDENDETTPVESQELGDISDDDLLEAAVDVKDTGELDKKEGVPGEAVLASTTLDKGFFITNKIEREQMRAKNKATYMEIIESSDVSEELKNETFNKMIQLTDIAEKENSTEIALEARGFDGTLVSINEGKVDVIVNAQSLSDQQLAIIEEEVKTRTGIPVENMTIIPIVVAE